MTVQFMYQHSSGPTGRAILYRLPRPHLVVVPLSVLGNWLREIAHWCPQLRALKLHGNKEERNMQKETVVEGGAFDVCVTTCASGGRTPCAWSDSCFACGTRKQVV
jgi:SNF2 family DNA or RNA helicase